MIRRRKHSVPALNTTSTADISFMLLIFFLLASSMGVDKGLMRQLPPANTHEEPLEVDVAKERLMELKITADNQVMLDGRLVGMDELRGHVASFVARVGKDHLISLDADPASNYSTYFAMQNEIVKAYATVRDAVARKRFGGRSLQRLTPTERNEIVSLVPQRIAEIYRVENEK